MAMHGWMQMLEGWPWFRGEGSFPLLPNSEFMPPVRLVKKPYGTWDSVHVSPDDPWGWPITEYDETLSLRPGMHDIAVHVLKKLIPLCHGKTDEHGISEYKLRDNPYWPPELAKKSHALEHERFVLLLPIALSITQDFMAHLRWTVFGNSEQGPARAFWKGFWTGPDMELPAEQALDFFHTLLGRAYGESAATLANLHQAGFRILPVTTAEAEPLPSWAIEYVINDDAPLKGVNYLLTFRPFRDLPAAVKRKYFAGDLHLLPFPGSLLFWGCPAYKKLAKTMRLAEQVPLLHFLERHEALGKIRVPQSGWFEEVSESDAVAKRKKLKEPGWKPIRDTYKRIFRQARKHRFDDHLVDAHEHRMPHVFFSTRSQDIDLYHKPMARNVQLWDSEYHAILDGPAGDGDAIRKAAERVAQGGTFGYRFLFPAMNVGKHELFWHRPVCAYYDARLKRPVLIDDAPTGYLTAYQAGSMSFDKPLELWPRLLRRENHVENVALFHCLKETPPWNTLQNVFKILDAFERNGSKPIEKAYARALLSIPKTMTLEGWLRSLSGLVPKHEKERASELAKHLRGLVDESERDTKPKRPAPKDASLTFRLTATREFEEAYWNEIANQSNGQFVNKNNADCVTDPITRQVLKHHDRDLEGLGDYILRYYEELFLRHGASDLVDVGELPFRWQTQYPFAWMGGWLRNQDGSGRERNLLVRIPGRDRSRAVVMADHYDTAYMYDRYDKHDGGFGARLSAPGADDNCSATVALMLGATPFLELSRQGKLECDVWLLHLTGEEYPAEGLGACRMCQWFIEGTLALHTKNGTKDLSGTRIQGLYVLDMIAHNINRDRNIFQISPGASRESQWLAEQALQANQAWNAATESWNKQPARKKAGAGRRSRDLVTIPPVAKFLSLQGQIRPHYDARSTLFNTDGQGFSDIGVPVVLFMENYDINRVGYHDTHDNMTLINLDYGAALAAITIEAVARAAATKLPAGYFEAPVPLEPTK
jgi:hypothetical protein